MKTSSSSNIGWLLIVLAIVAIIGLVFITLYYSFSDSFGQPFGALDDKVVALGGILNGVLVLLMYPFHRSYTPRASRFALASGVIGAFLVPIGVRLVVYDVTGWILSSLVSTFGFALIGIWALS